MTLWVRTGGGRTIHKRGCWVLKRAKAEDWFVAGSVNEQAVFLSLNHPPARWSKNWNRFCSRCCPEAAFEQRIILEKVA